MFQKPELKISTISDETVNGIRRKIEFQGAYNFRDKEKYGADYDIHPVEILFSVSKDRCAVVLQWNTQWYLDEIDTRRGKPYGYIAYHYPIQLSEYCVSNSCCKYIGCDCFSYWSGLDAARFSKDFLEDPSTLWPFLEEKLSDLISRVKGEINDRAKYS